MNAGTWTLKTVGAFRASSLKINTAAYRLASTRSKSESHAMLRFTSMSTMSAVSAPPTDTKCPSARDAASASVGSHVGVMTSLKYVANLLILPTFSPSLASVSWSIAYTPPSRCRKSGELINLKIRR